MIDAAAAFCLSTPAAASVHPDDFDRMFASSVADHDTRSYWEAAALVLNDIFARDNDIHASQLRYVAKVYPERVSIEEAADVWATICPEARPFWFEAAESASAIAGNTSRDRGVPAVLLGR